MNKIKDLIYNINDIAVALLIVALAGGIIYWRVGSIMDYPAYAAELKKQNEIFSSDDFSDVDLTLTPIDERLNEKPDDFNVSDPGEDSPKQSSESQPSQEPQTEQPQAQQPEQPSESTQPAEQDPDVFRVKEETSFTVPAGSSGDKIASLLLQQGLVESKESFIKTLVEMKADTRLQAGTFTIPAGSTVEDIVSILTK